MSIYNNIINTKNYFIVLFRDVNSSSLIVSAVIWWMIVCIWLVFFLKPIVLVILNLCYMRLYIALDIHYYGHQYFMKGLRIWWLFCCEWNIVLMLRNMPVSLVETGIMIIGFQVLCDMMFQYLFVVCGSSYLMGSYLCFYSAVNEISFWCWEICQFRLSKLALWL